MRTRLLTGLGAGAALGAAALWAAPGCNIVAPAFLLVHGPQRFPAQYDLPKERPAVIFFDDRGATVQRRPTRERLVAAAEAAMLKAGVVDRLLDSKAASTVVANEPRGDLMPISEVGRAINAEVVIYVMPDVFTLTPDGQTFQPTARLRVKVMDAVADSRLWPEEEREGYTLEVTGETKQGSPPTDASSAREAEEQFADLVGLRIAQLFYEHEKEYAAAKRDR